MNRVQLPPDGPIELANQILNDMRAEAQFREEMNHQCPAIIASGANEGKVCGRATIILGPKPPYYCHYHKGKYVAHPKPKEEPEDEPADEPDNIEIDQVIIRENQGQCSFCLDNVKISQLWACIPCGHACLCNDCKDNFGRFKRYTRCLICNRNIDSITKLYFPTLEVEAGPMMRVPREQNEAQVVPVKKKRNFFHWLKKRFN